MDESKLLQKLQDIEALFVGATTGGERDAASNARQRILQRLASIAKEDPPVEVRFSLDNRWNKRLFLALLRRYELKPYRYPRQRRTTVVVKVPKRFLDETLWPQFKRLSEELEQHLDEIANSVIADAMQADGSDAEVVEEPKALPPGS